jgi:hypothetical protein
VETEHLAHRRIRQRAVDDRLQEAEPVIGFHDLGRNHAVFSYSHIVLRLNAVRFEAESEPILAVLPCPLRAWTHKSIAKSRPALAADECPLSGVKRTLRRTTLNVRL